MATRTPLPEGAAFSYEVGKGELEDQLRRIQALDSKTGILLAAAGVFAGLIFGSETLLGEAPRWAATLTAAATVISLLLGIIAFANRRYRTAPTSVAVVRLMSESEAWLKWRFLGNILQAIAINEAKLRWKTRFLSLSLIAFLVAVASAGGWFIYAIIGGTV